MSVQTYPPSNWEAADFSSSSKHEGVPSNMLDFFTASAPPQKTAASAPPTRSRGLNSVAPASVDDMSKSLASASLNNTINTVPKRHSLPPSLKSNPQQSVKQDDDDEEGDEDEDEGRSVEEAEAKSAMQRKSKKAADKERRQSDSKAKKAEAQATDALRIKLKEWLADPDFYWQEQRSDAVSKVGFTKHHVSWRFVLGGRLHELDLSHSPLSGKRVIRIDGAEVVNEKATLEAHAVHEISIDDCAVRVSLTQQGWGLTTYTYDLLIDDHPFEVAKKNWLIKVKNQLEALGGASVNASPCTSSKLLSARKK